MINKLFDKIFLSNHEKEINKITADLAFYWEKTNDLNTACERYLQDLNAKYFLGFDDNEIINITSIIHTKTRFVFGLSNPNILLIFGEFVYYCIFGGKLPSKDRNSKENIFNYLSNLEKYIIDNPAPWNDKINKVLNRKSFI